MKPLVTYLALRLHARLPQPRGNRPYSGFVDVIIESVEARGVRRGAARISSADARLRRSLVARAGSFWTVFPPKRARSTASRCNSRYKPMTFPFPVHSGALDRSRPLSTASRNLDSSDLLSIPRDTNFLASRPNGGYSARSEIRASRRVLTTEQRGWFHDQARGPYDAVSRGR